MKKNTLGIGIVHCLFLVGIFALGYFTSLEVNPQTIALEDYQTLNQDMVDRLKAESCADEVNKVRKELDEKFKIAWAEKEGIWKNFETCDNQPLIIESNVVEICDTTELEECTDMLGECADANERLQDQLLNFMYE